MKAIQTKYKGFHFRSRLEARWAVFFDALGIKWEYEPEGFELSDGTRYLPDFHISRDSNPGPEIWYEVKPLEVKRDPKFAKFVEDIRAIGDAMCEGAVAHDIAAMCEARAVLLSGTPRDMLLSSHTLCPRCGVVMPASNINYNFFPYGEIYLCCWGCDFSTPSGGGHAVDTQSSIFGIPFRPHKGSLVIDSADWAVFLARVIRAVDKSSSARFEFGECGATA